MRLKKLTPEEELNFMKEVYGANDYARLFSVVKDSFALIQTRAQMLLGLATICLTITGFSGPRMAASNPFSRFFIGFGLLFVLASVVAIVAGPLRLRWLTAWRVDSLDETLLENLRRRDSKTFFYRIATLLLLIGLTGYLLSLIFYLSTVD
jgi:cytochrome c oxidase assembly factor CtaG